MAKWLSLLFLASGLTGGGVQKKEPAAKDLNGVDYQSWYKEALDKKSSFGDVGGVYMVKNTPPIYDPGRIFSDEELVRLKGDIFTNFKGNLEIVIVIYDLDQRTPIFGVYVEDVNQLDNLENLSIFYWDQEKWRLVPDDIAQRGPGPELFWYLYQKTGKLIHYQ